MERTYKINIPEPCNEDWNKMTPTNNGKFCTSCAKTVVDFTTMLPDEIQSYFSHNPNKNTCGRFKKTQIETVTISIPEEIVYSQTNFHKMFLLALFIAMGTTLFSCKNDDGTKQKIDKIEITNDIVSSETTLSLTPKSADSLQNKTPLSKKTPQAKFKKHRATTYNEPLSKKEQSINDEKVIYEDNTAYGVIGLSVYPDYKGGIAKFYSFIKDNYKQVINNKSLKGEIEATFEIDQNGTLNDVTIIKGLNSTINQELIRVLKSSPEWYPGEQNGKKRNCKFQLSVSIKPDTIKKSFFRTQILTKIDSLEIKQITKYENYMFTH
jgi:Na+-translocating ferredoxin:NAD+ oxidoreductase RnfG subunit